MNYLIYDETGEFFDLLTFESVEEKNSYLDNNPGFTATLEEDYNESDFLIEEEDDDNEIYEDEDEDDQIHGF